MARIHETLSGQRIEYPDPDAKLDRFLKRVHDIVEDAAATEDTLVALVYGRENPILDHTIFPERGAVTKAVLDSPVYAVLSDLITRKRLQQDGGDAKKLGSKHTLTVSDAAARKGVSEDAIRKAIRERRLPAWKREGGYFLDPRSLDALELGGRGPVGAHVKPLAFRVGYDREHATTFKLVVDGQPQPQGASEEPVSQGRTKWDGKVERWRRAAIFTGVGGKARFFELVPSTSVDAEAVKLDEFFVEGHFMVIRKENSAKAAREAWEAFRAP